MGQVTINGIFIADSHVDEMISNSFRDYHVKGFDYICIKRSDRHTVKVYFFDEPFVHMPEVVQPHDHRYRFRTTVAAGRVRNIVYQTMADRLDRNDIVYNEFEYLSPLNGWNGFTYKQRTKLAPFSIQDSIRGQCYSQQPKEIHTIRIMQPDTILILDQYEDELALDKPTRFFSRDDAAPNLSGLYNKFTPDQLLARLATLDSRLLYGLTRGFFAGLVT